MDLTGKTIIKEYSNQTMEQLLGSMEKYLQTAKGQFGYAIARNTRKIGEACEEYLKIQQDLINELGQKEKDENGNFTGNCFIKIGTPAYDKYLEKIKTYTDIKHTAEIYQIPYNALPEDLTAREMLKVEWMLCDSENQEKIIK